MATPKYLGYLLILSMVLLFCEASRVPPAPKRSSYDNVANPEDEPDDVTVPSTGMDSNNMMACTPLDCLSADGRCGVVYVKLVPQPNNTAQLDGNSAMAMAPPLG
ncbi:hypothetical protein AAHE18_20G041400 [Arachis hypogaea]